MLVPGGNRNPADKLGVGNFGKDNPAWVLRHQRRVYEAEGNAEGVGGEQCPGARSQGVAC